MVPAGSGRDCDEFAQAGLFLPSSRIYDAFSPEARNLYWQQCMRYWMSGGTGEGPHMWNLVSMGSGANYLADITNCDEGSVGYPDELFMAGSGRPYSDNGLSGYIFSANGSDIVYAYDGDMAGLYTEAELTVSDTAYTEAEPQIVADGVFGDRA